MEVFKAHRARVADLQGALDECMRLEMEFHGICAESWELQKEYTEENLRALKGVHQQMEEMAHQIISVRHRLEPQPAATHVEAFPIKTRQKADSSVPQEQAGGDFANADQVLAADAVPA